MFEIFKRPLRCSQCQSTDIFVARSWTIGELPADYVTVARDAKCCDCGHSWPLKPLREAIWPITPPHFVVTFRDWTVYRMEVSAATAEEAVAIAKVQAAGDLWKLDAEKCGQDNFNAVTLTERRSCRRRNR